MTRGTCDWYYCTSFIWIITYKLQFISNYPDKASTVVPIACTSSHSAQNIAFNELGRQAIASDHNWSDGKYLSNNTLPDKGLSVARMAAHITYLLSLIHI